MDYYTGHNILQYGYEVTIDRSQLPIAPSKITTKIKGKNKVIDLASGAELNLINPAGLTEIEFDALLPKYKGYYFSRYFMQQEDYLKLFQRLKDESKKHKKTFQFVIVRDNIRDNSSTAGKLTTNFPMMTLEDYTVHEDAKSYGHDVLVSLKLKQYIPPKLKKLKVEKPKDDKGKTEVSKEEIKESTKPKTATHTVVRGDMLSVLCKKYLGDGTRATYERIAKLNNISNADLIYPGQVIKFE